MWFLFNLAALIFQKFGKNTFSQAKNLKMCGEVVSLKVVGKISHKVVSVVKI